ncbi:hypothetical protein, partial [Oceanispirochaeta sp.]|uniref:hypothetical protein n=1 Tax=Oceanispirochaeta sp. TaxID=2035350 RepID=UPI00260A0E16
MMDDQKVYRGMQQDKRNRKKVTVIENRPGAELPKEQDKMENTLTAAEGTAIKAADKHNTKLAEVVDLAISQG